MVSSLFASLCPMRTGFLILLMVLLCTYYILGCPSQTKKKMENPGQKEIFCWRTNSQISISNLSRHNLKFTLKQLHLPSTARFHKENATRINSLIIIALVLILFIFFFLLSKRWEFGRFLYSIPFVKLNLPYLRVPFINCCCCVCSLWPTCFRWDGTDGNNALEKPYKSHDIKYNKFVAKPWNYKQSIGKFCLLYLLPTFPQNRMAYYYCQSRTHYVFRECLLLSCVL